MQYLINSDGRDTNPEGPWCTVERATAAIAAGVIYPGDEILLRDGDTFVPSERLVIGGSSGVDGKMIILGRYGDGPKPIIDFNWNPFFLGRYDDSLPADFFRLCGLELRNVSRQCMMPVRGCVGWWLDDLHLHDAVDDGGWCALLQARYASDMLITGLVAERSEGEGVYIGSAPGTDPNDCVERLTMRDYIIRDCDNEGLDVKDGSTWGCLFEDGLVENCGVDEGQQVSLGGTLQTMRRVKVRRPPAGLRASVRVSNYNVPAGTGTHILFEDSFVEGQFGERDGHPCACVRMYPDLNTLRRLTLANSAAGISAWAASDTPGATQVIDDIGFSNVVEWINYVSNESCFSVSNLWEVSEMLVVSELQLVIAGLQAEISRIEQVITDLLVLDADADAVVVEAQEALDAAEVLADKIQEG